MMRHLFAPALPLCAPVGPRVAVEKCCKEDEGVEEVKDLLAACKGITWRQVEAIKHRRALKQIAEFVKDDCKKLSLGSESCMTPQG